MIQMRFHLFTNYNTKSYTEDVYLDLVRNIWWFSGQKWVVVSMSLSTGSRNLTVGVHSVLFSGY